MINLKLTIRWKLSETETCIMVSVFKKGYQLRPNIIKNLKSIFISVINQLDAQNFCFTLSLFHASTCFEHMCSSSGGQNCITQPLVSCTPIGMTIPEAV